MSEEFLAQAPTAGSLVKSELVSEAAGAETVPTGGEARGAVMSEEFLAEATTAGSLVKSELVSEAAEADTAHGTRSSISAEAGTAQRPSTCSTSRWWN